MRERGHQPYHRPVRRAHRDRPEFLDRFVISGAILLAAAAVYLGARRLSEKGPEPQPPPDPPAAPARGRERALPTVAALPPLERDVAPAPRAEAAVDTVPPVAIARTGKLPSTKKIEPPVPK